MLTLENYKYLFLLHPKDKAFCCFTINGSEKRELTAGIIKIMFLFEFCEK